MKVLVLAPLPFYQERGRLIVVNTLLKALSDLGHAVEVIAFPGGRDVAHPDVTIHRACCVGLRGEARPGLTPAKIILHACMFCRALALMARRKPDVIHAIEESVLTARMLSAFFGVPYVYGMHSTLGGPPDESFIRGSLWRRVVHRFYRAAVIRAVAVASACPGLTRAAREWYRPQHLIGIGGASLLGDPAPAEPAVPRAPSEPLVFMYAGGLERHQGVDLLIEAFSLHHRRRRQDRLVIIGGTDRQIARCREHAAALHCNGSIEFAGPQPVSDLARHLARADILVSPRLRGHCAPMKLYSYLDSGRAVLATRLYVHTQIIDDEQGLLVDPTPEQLADGMRRLATSPALRRQLADGARSLVRHKHTYPQFKAAIEDLYNVVAESRATH